MSAVEQRIKDIIRENATGDYGPEAFIDGVDTESAAQAITAEHVVIPKASLPRTSYDPSSETDRWVTFDKSGPIAEAAYAVTDSVQAWEMARHWAAIALSVEVQEDNARNKRRDEIVRERSGNPNLTYAEVNPIGQQLTDRIIELEAAL